MANTPLLNLDTLAEVRQVSIDNNFYPLFSVEQLPILPLRRLELNSARLSELFAIANPTQADEQEVSRLLDAAARTIVDAPPEVHARLTHVQRLAILNVFGQLRPTATTRATTGASTRPSTTVNSSRGSSRNTAARRKTGSRRSR